ncbi:MAG: leucine-rich repeat domain-containing protein, partial [Clostridiales bacterium]|nr:leucine-rich repeat domain-containing protein [Clostridiales bacterium]
MKANKKRIFLVFAILTMALLLSFVFVACDKKKDEPAPPQNTSPSEGLEYSFDKYGSHYGYVVTDIGSCTDNNVIIPSEYKSRTVKSIGDNAFKDCIGITSITIPDSVTSIGNEAFSGCTKLENIYYTGDIASWCKISGLNNLLTSLRTL